MSLTAKSAKVAKIFTAMLCALCVLCDVKQFIIITLEILISRRQYTPMQPPHIKNRSMQTTNSIRTPYEPGMGISFRQDNRWTGLTCKCFFGWLTIFIASSILKSGAAVPMLQHRHLSIGELTHLFMYQ